MQDMHRTRRGRREPHSNRLPRLVSRTPIIDTLMVILWMTIRATTVRAQESLSATVEITGSVSMLGDIVTTIHTYCWGLYAPLAPFFLTLAFTLVVFWVLRFLRGMMH